MSTLYLIPTPLGRQRENRVLPAHTIETARRLRQFVVENIRTAQGFLQWIDHPLEPYEPEFRLLNRKTPDQEIYSFVKLLRNGDLGLLSEAGAPAVADPGEKLVRMAHDAGHRVTPLVGPSSILLALMASGLPGQQFTFHGYLPRKKPALVKTLQSLEEESRRENRTQLFMETPFRNQALFNTLLETARPDTQLCIASQLTLPDEDIATRSIRQWRDQRPQPELDGRPTIFLIYCKKG